MNMQTEGAWHALHANIKADAPIERIREVRDNFILAVRAEMPCYDDGWGIGDNHACPSCDARHELEQ